MAKVKQLNFLLELGQKNLHAIKKGTVDRYKRELSFLLSTGLKHVGYLWPYQEGLAAVIEDIKRFVDGKSEDVATLANYVVEKKGTLHVHGASIYADHTFKGEPAELGKMLICDQLYKLDLTREDFAYCEYCSGVYAVKSSKSRFCSQTCNVQYNRAEKLKTQEEP